MKRRERGIAAYASQFGVSEAEVERLFLERFGPRFAEEAFHAAGDAWRVDALSLRDRSLIVLAALAAQGGADSRLRPHVRWAVEHGATAAELDALGCLLSTYVGFPRASVALEAIREELRLAGVPADAAEDG
ncbi:MAG TPA: carboxymuconolactone decarboxylase family protein [Gaiellaceae bacterium]|nr:carboxymuconolactone decarboxylase family protein [Gaiellaceae bacterium]